MSVDYSGLIKSLVLPADFVMPRHLAHGRIRATVLGRDDLEDDVQGINSSLDLILRTRGGGWPTEPVTSEDNYMDLVWHELEFREGYSFSYVVRDSEGGYLGCCYLYPLGRRVALTEELLQHDVDVSWWVTARAYDQGYYVELYDALRHWIDEVLPFSRPYFSNTEIPS
jgi:hypothetical protein